MTTTDKYLYKKLKKWSLAIDQRFWKFKLLNGMIIKIVVVVDISIFFGFQLGEF